MKVISISGTQGAGKTTMLAELKNRGWKVDDYKVSRDVQKSLGWDSLDRVLDSVDAMLEFQTTVWEKKFAHDKELAAFGSEDDIVLVERSFADIFSYTKMWCDKHTGMSDEQKKWFITDYAPVCKLSQVIYSGVVYVPLMRHIKWVDDPNRAALEDVEAFNNHATSFINDMPIEIPRMFITMKTVKARANQVEQFLNSIKENSDGENR
jgi:hypothetical protein